MSRFSLGPESDTSDLWISLSFFADFILYRSPPQVSIIEGVETDINLLVSVHGKGVEGVLVIIDHYSQLAVCEFLICPLPTS